MTTIDDLAEHSVRLKREVLDFAKGHRFDRAFRQEIRHRFGDPIVADEEEIHNFYDWFIQQYRRPDGKTVIDCFLETRSDLPEDEREFLLGWREVVEGIFEVTGRDGPTLVTVNVIDDLEYRMRTNSDPAVLDNFPVGGFLATRVVPLGESWLLSGSQQVFTADHRDVVLPAAARMALTDPALTFRNPERLARGWELQRASRKAFIEHFGSDMIVLEGSEAPTRLRRFTEQHPDAMHERLATVVEHMHPDAATIGLIYDDLDGLGVYQDLRLVEEAFNDPELARTRPYRQLLKNYLTDDTTSPVPLIRLAERDQTKATKLFRRLLGKPRFTWDKDGEALLRDHKPTWYERPPLPRTIVISDRLVPYVPQS